MAEEIGELCEQVECLYIVYVFFLSLPLPPSLFLSFSQLSFCFFCLSIGLSLSILISGSHLARAPRVGRAVMPVRAWAQYYVTIFSSLSFYPCMIHHLLN